MANALNRNLKVGDKVVMLNGESVEICDDLFGNASFTSGSAIAVRCRRGEVKASGFEIDPVETMKRHAEENGWVDAVSAE